MKKLAIFILLLICIAGGTVLYFNINQKALKQILSTEPIIPSQNFIDVTIDKIEGNTLYVTQHSSPGQARSFKVNINKNTQIKTALPAKSVAVQLTASTVPFDGTINDIKVGQSVGIVTSTDMTKSDIKEIIATVINIPAILNVVSGNIVSIESDKMNILATKPIHPLEIDLIKTTQTEKQDYRVTITDSTQIFQGTYSIEDKRVNYNQVKLSDLKKDLYVTVYADSEVTNKVDITAQYIDILPPPTELSTFDNPMAEE